jgi:hypothetical protein
VVLLATGVPLLLVVSTASGWPHQLGNVGAWLHLGGLLVVAYGLIETRCRLRGRSAWECVRAALLAPFRRWHREPTNVGLVGARSESRDGVLDVHVGAPWSGTDRDMIVWLEKELAALGSRVDRELAQAEEARRAGDEAVAAEVREEVAAREAAVQEVQHLLRSLTIGGLRIETVGITWLALGFMVATWPDCVLWLWSLVPFLAP